ncbi:MAG: hypothetical protein ISR76_09860 [Planctomycetes bacterium]|nr:hypothetical protein [Planctomycetota bacterium]
MNRFPLLSLLAAVAFFGADASGQVIGDRATLQNLLGGNGVLHDFEAYNVAFGGAENINVLYLDEFTIANGQGPGLVSDGAAYSCALNTLQWNGDAYFGLPTKTFLANSGDGILTISYDAPGGAFGVDLLTFQGYGDSAVVEVFDPAGALIYASAPLSVSGPSPVFFGYQAPAIGSVRISSMAYSWGIVINDHLFGSISGPSLTVNRLIAGVTASLTVSNATPGGVVGVAYSLSGGGPSTANVGGCGAVSVSLSAPIRILPPMVANAAGTATWSANVPAGTTGVMVWVQGMDVASCALTNGVAQAIG